MKTLADSRTVPCRQSGFTLVEIMIAVVIIGLLATMAIPAFRKSTETSVFNVVRNDARLLGEAAQQYMMDTGLTEVSVSVDPDTGKVSGTLAAYVKHISKGTSLNATSIKLTDSFQMQNPMVDDNAPLEFSCEGKYLPSN